jgi:hypothetical protein
LLRLTKAAQNLEKMMEKRIAMTLVIWMMNWLSIGTAHAGPLGPTWSDITTGAAAGYCLAKHPYRYGGGTFVYGSDTYTKEGYEVVASPGIVGGVRRNFVYNRSTLDKDEGNENSTCAQACGQFGQLYGPSYKGVPLKQIVSGAKVPINSGIGDMAALVMPDQDFYLGTTVVAGIWSRGNTWHESDVAQADFCCCQAR